MICLRRLFFFATTLSLLYGQEISVTIMVIPSSKIAESDCSIFIAGNKAEFGNWNPGISKLEKSNDGAWIFVGKFLKGSILQFKITNGTWEGEAVYDSITVPQNIILEAAKDTTVIIRPLFWKSDLKRAKPEPSIKGTVVYHRQLVADGLKHKRDIIVWLPPSYEKNSTKHYPVLYMHDGQNIFDPTTAFTGYDWRIDEVADSLIAIKKIEEIIIVGIYNTPDRLPEYADSPLGDAYLEFVVNVVKPLIDSTYRTKPDRKHTAVMGSSMGALSSLLFAWKRPDIFGMAGCLSTSFWYDDEKTLKEVRNSTGHKKEVRIYLDCGGREKELLGGYRRMVDILKKKGYKKGRDLEYYRDSAGVHSEHSWAKRVWRPLVFMFGRK